MKSFNPDPNAIIKKKCHISIVDNVKQVNKILQYILIRESKLKNQM